MKGKRGSSRLRYCLTLLREFNQSVVWILSGKARFNSTRWGFISSFEVDIAEKTKLHK